MDPREVLTRDAEPPDAVVRYADHADGIVDVFLPPVLTRPAAPRHLVVLVHGGFWRHVVDRRHLRPLANALATDRYVVAVPEYRRSGRPSSGDGAADAGTDRPLPGWPACGEDVLAVLRQARGLVDGVAPGWIDPTAPATVIGHSAGGHLTLWAGLRCAPDVVGAVLALAPVSDVTDAAVRDLDGGAAVALIGRTVTEAPETYRAADAARVARHWSVAPDRRVVVVHGADDDRVPVAMSRALADAVELEEVAGTGHFELIDPLSDVWREVVRPLLPVSPGTP